MSNALRNRYKADLREFAVPLFEQFKPQRAPRPGALRRTGARRKVKTVLAPGSRLRPRGPRPAQRGRRPGLQARERQRHTPTGFKDAWKTLYDVGSERSGVPEEFGGAGARARSRSSLEEILSGRERGVQHVPGPRVRRGRGDRAVRARSPEERGFTANA